MAPSFIVATNIEAILVQIGLKNAVKKLRSSK